MCRKHEYREKNKGHVTKMGMAASQASLLTITSRLHDVEYKAQNIENRKIDLATQKDEVYQTYCDALNAKKIQIAFNAGDGSKNFVDANFSTVCGYDSNRFRQYSISDARTGKVIVDEETEAAYNEYKNDKYSFAWKMVLGEDSFSWNDELSGEFVGGNNQSGCEFLTMTEVEQMVYDENCEGNEKLTAAHDAIENAESPADKQKALREFRDLLYKTCGEKIFDLMNLNKQDGKEQTLADKEDNRIIDNTWSGCSDKFNYYVKLWEQINNAGGCQQIDQQYASGSDGNDWFNNMVNSGLVLISEWNPDKKEWQDTSVATSTNGNYLQEVADDVDLKKAEAQYQHELGIINKKDSKYDKELSNLETERTAMKTEIDAIKTVRNDNIDRTFGIFS